MNALNKASLVATGATFARSYSTPDVPTLADGLRLVDASTALSGDQRRNLRSDLKTVAAMLRRAPDAILLDCPALSDALLTRPSRAYGLAPRRHRNVMSSLRFILRLLQVSEPKGMGPREFSPAWLEIWNQIESTPVKASVSRLFAFFSRRGIAPELVDGDFLNEFVEHLHRAELIRQPRWLATRIFSAWNKLVTLQPPGRLNGAVRTRGRKPYTKPAGFYPPSFGTDLRLFATIRSTADVSVLFDDLLDDDRSGPARPPKPLRASTIALRVDQLLLAAAALVNTGRAPETITCLKDLVYPLDTVKTILTFFWERGGQKK